MKRFFQFITVSAAVWLLLAAPAHAGGRFVVKANIATDPDAPADVEELMVIDIYGHMQLKRGILVPNANDDRLDDRLRPFDAQNVDCNDDNVAGNADGEVYGPEYNLEEFIVRIGGTVVARLDSLSGNLYIKGDIDQNESNFDEVSGLKYFRIKNLYGQVVAHISSAGDMRLRGFYSEEVALIPNFTGNIASFGDSVVVGYESFWLPAISLDTTPSLSNPDISGWLEYLGTWVESGSPEHAFSSGHVLDGIFSHAEHIDIDINPAGFNDDDLGDNTNFGVIGARWHETDPANESDFLQQVAVATNLQNDAGPFNYAVIYFGGNDICAYTDPSSINCNYFNDEPDANAPNRERGVRASLTEGIKRIRDSPKFGSDTIIVVLEVFDFVDLWDKVASATFPNPAAAWCTAVWWMKTNLIHWSYCDSFLTEDEEVRNATRENIRQMNQVLENVCNREKVYFKRGIFDIFEDPSFHLTEMGADCIHPGGAVHDRIADMTWDESLFKD